MGTLTVALVILAALLLVACATTHPSTPVLEMPDSTRALWGDENAGLTTDPGVEAETRVHGHGSVEWFHARTTRVSLDARSAVAAVLARNVDGHSAGAVSLRPPGIVREVVVGSLRAAAGEGALLADTRANVLTSVASPGVPGLRVTPTSLVWGTGVGAAVVLAPGPVQVSLAHWRLRDEPGAHHAWAGLEWRGAGAVVGALAGGMQTPWLARPLAGGSVFAGRALGGAWVSGEAAAVPVVREDSARAGHAARVTIRAVAGERGEWRVSAATGPAVRNAVAGDHAVTSAVIERHAARGAVAGRVRLLISEERTGDGRSRRRRADAGASWRLTPRITLDGAVRVTRDEESDTRATAFVTALPPERRHEVRARVGLRTAHDASGARVSNDYRIELVEDGGAGTGVVGTWSLRIDAGPLSWRVRATASALHDGQVAYVSNDGVRGAAAFSVLSAAGSAEEPAGAALVATLRARVTRHAALGAQLARPRVGDPRAEFFASASW